MVFFTVAVVGIGQEESIGTLLTLFGRVSMNVGLLWLSKIPIIFDVCEIEDKCAIVRELTFWETDSIEDHKE